MSADSRNHNDSPQLAEEGSVLRQISLLAATAYSIDCSALQAEGCKVRIMHNGSGVLAYKFSATASATGLIDFVAASGVNAGAFIGPQSDVSGFIPKGKPYLHMIDTATSNVSVERASSIR